MRYSIIRDVLVAVLIVITLAASAYAVTRPQIPGPAGARGAQGTTGAQGEAGPQGAAGAAADTGPRGLCVTYTTGGGETWVSGVSSPIDQGGVISCPNGGMVSSIPVNANS